ncbi:MBL fold metallo-hydrolase [Roseococcus sp. YIM B11640]|uniref:MBL fold metallo-hydrolase n=1 Tax=Roseococcus sp. YIM B11640 TaxID=3133973 RepID=UPI003C7EAE89
MANFICVTCGTQHAESETAPERCAICDDERQYVPAAGQRWTTLEAMRRTLAATFRHEAGVLGIGTSPSFGIGQRALLVRTPAGNLLWDCISLIDDAMVEIIQALGGIAGIAISHPHYYTTMVEWSRRFGDVPVHLHAADRQWVMRPDPCIRFWEGETLPLLKGLTLIRAGGHYPGGTVLHARDAGPEGKGALFTGDILQVTADSRHLGFMRSYPNFIPLGAAAVERVAASVLAFDFDAIYGAFWERVIPRGGRAAINASVARHVHWLGRGALE